MFESAVFYIDFYPKTKVKQQTFLCLYIESKVWMFRFAPDICVPNALRWNYQSMTRGCIRALHTYIPYLTLASKVPRAQCKTITLKKKNRMIWDLSRKKAEPIILDICLWSIVLSSFIGSSSFRYTNINWAFISLCIINNSRFLSLMQHTSIGELLRRVSVGCVDFETNNKPNDIYVRWMIYIKQEKERLSMSINSPVYRLHSGAVFLIHWQKRFAL